MTLRGAQLRIARATTDLEPVIAFYRDGLGFEVLGGFTDHEGFDGVMLGHPNAPYHLEFVRHSHITRCRAPTDENLLVFYLPKESAWSAAVERMRAAGYTSVVAANPYWDQLGVTFEDADGYRVVFQRGSWPTNENESDEP